MRLDYRGAEVTAKSISVPSGFMGEFDASLLLFATGLQAGTRESLGRLSDQMDEALEILHDIKDLAVGTEAALMRGDLAAVARCIAEQQRLKQKLPGTFTDDLVSEVVSRLRPLGVSVQFPGGKVGAYMFVCCPDGQQKEVRAVLSEFDELPLRLSMGGSRLVGR